MPTLTAPPALRSPAADAVVPLDAAVFQWDAVPGEATGYALQIAPDASFEAPVVDVADLQTTELALSNAFPAGRLWWRVRAEGSEWSAPAAFVSGTPADAEVARRVEAGQQRLDRLAARDARRQARPTAGTPGAPPDPVWPHVSGPSLDTAAPPVDWATVSGFGPPERAAEETVAGEPPALVSPIGGEVVDAATATFRWRGAPEATGYDAEVSPDEAFERDVLALSAGAATEVALQGTLPPLGTRLFWRVRARTPRGVTAWSRPGRFYPAGIDAAERFHNELAAALDARRRQRAYARRQEAQTLDLLPAHERADAASSTLQAAAFVAMGGLCVAAAVGLILIGLFAG